MAKKNIIFGFGSLMYAPSLLATAPSATNIRPAYIKGFIRSFNLWDAVGNTVTNLDLAGEPMCALDVAKTTDNETRVNGVVFTVDKSDLARLIKREAGYKLIEVSAYDYQTEQLITDECLVFSANKNDGKYVFDGKAQQRYLEDYLKGAREYGEKFYHEVLDTTFIDDTPLKQVKPLSGFL